MNSIQQHLLRYAITTFIICYTLRCLGQSEVNRSVVSSGGSVNNGQLIMDWSLGGQPMVSSTTTSSGVLITHGLLQPIFKQIDLVLIFDPISQKTYEDVDFVLTATASDGSPIDYESSDPTVAEIISGSTVKIVGAGNARIRATIRGTSISKEQILVVDKASQTITFSVIPILYKNGTGYKLNAVSNKGLPVTYESNNPFVVRINGEIITPVDVGEGYVTALQEGNKNYKPASANQLARVFMSEGQDVSVARVVSPNGDGINDRLVISGIDFYPNNQITIANRNGTIVYRAKNITSAGLSMNVTDSGYETGFDAKFRAAYLPGGTYFYSLRYQKDGIYKTQTGYFMIKYK